MKTEFGYKMKKVEDLILNLSSYVDLSILQELAACRESGINDTFSDEDYNKWIEKYGDMFIKEYNMTIKEFIKTL